MVLDEALTLVKNLSLAETNPERIAVYNQCHAIFSEVGVVGVVARYKAMYESNRVEAIKAYRTEFNVPLMVAKQTIEDMAKHYNWRVN